MTPLQKAAKALLDRWDSTYWKDQRATSEYVNELRKALADEQSQSVEPREFEQWLNFNRGLKVSEVFHEIIARTVR